MDPQAAATGNTGIKRMGQDLQRWSAGAWRVLSDLVLPPICVHCHAPIADHGVLCAECWRGIDFISPPICTRLGTPMTYAGQDDQPILSTAAMRDPPVFARARAAARFNGVMRNLLHGFKYADRHESAKMIARMMWAAGHELLPDTDLILPVPLHPRKLFKRRFNQAAILARYISAFSATPVDLFSLKRQRHTRSQVGLDAQSRQGNMATAFFVAPSRRRRLEGKRVLLIDDVMTTGSTLNACALALKDAGAQDVDCLAAALVAYQPKTARAVPHLGVVS